MRMWQGSSGVSECNGIVSPAYTVLTPRDNCNSKYLAYLFKTEKALNLFTRFSQGLTTDTWNLKFNILKNIKFFAPNVLEQEKISQLLLKLDKIITLEQEKYEKMSSILKETIDIYFANQSDNETKINKVFEFSSGVSKTNEICINGHYKIIDMGAISSNGENVSYKTTNNNSDMLKIGDLVMPKDDIGGGLIIGKTIFIDAPNTYVLGDHVYLLQKISDKINNKFMHYFSLSKRYSKEIKKITTGSAQLGVTSSNIGKILIPLPSKDKQEDIVNFFDSFRSNINKLYLKIAKLKSIKQFLLQNLFI